MSDTDVWDIGASTLLQTRCTILKHPVNDSPLILYGYVTGFFTEELWDFSEKIPKFSLRFFRCVSVFEA